MPEYLVRASALEGFDEVTRDLGGNPTDFRTQSGLPAETVSQDSWISYRAFLNLLELAAEELNCPHFGLLLSRHQGVSTLGAVGFVMREASTVGRALAELSRHFSYHNQGAEVELRIEKNQAMLEFIPKLAGELDHRRQADLVVGIGLNLMKLLCGGGWKPSAVYFSHSKPEDLKPYKNILGCTMHFNWENYMMVFPAVTLDTPISQADEHLHRILEGHLALVKSSYPGNYTGQIKHLIRQALLTGDCSVDRVATYLSITKRTLQRKLKAEDTNYRELLDQVRLDMAAHYLRESHSSLTALADMLGYSELSAFSNAFKQQTGLSPREWRAQYAH